MVLLGQSNTKCCEEHDLLKRNFTNGCIALSVNVITFIFGSARRKQSSVKIHTQDITLN